MACRRRAVHPPPASRFPFPLPRRPRTDRLSCLASARLPSARRRYIAPEILNELAYNSAIDWWTFGCLVYEMVHGKRPFRSLDMSQLLNMIKRAKVHFRPDLCSEVLEDLLRQLITVDGDARLGSPTMGGAAKLKEHAFFREVDWDALLRKEVAAPCALSEMFSESSLPPRATTRELREDRLQTEFTTFTAGDDAEEEELSFLKGASATGHAEHARELHSPLHSRGMPSYSPLSHDGSPHSRDGSRKASLTAVTPVEFVDSPSLYYQSSVSSSYEPNSSSSSLSLELTRTGAIWAISHSLVRALGYNHMGKQQLLGRSMLDSSTSLVEAAGFDKFVDTFAKAREALDERLVQQEQPPAAAAVAAEGAADGVESPAAEETRLSEVTVWLSTAVGGRMCVQASLEVVLLDASYAETGGPAGLVVFTMSDVTTSERNKELVARRYERPPISAPISAPISRPAQLACDQPACTASHAGALSAHRHARRALRSPWMRDAPARLLGRYELAYNAKAPDADLIDFFDHYVEESIKSVPVPGSKHGARSPVNDVGSAELSSGVRAYLERRRILIRAFPDLHFTMLEQTTQGGTVYTSWQWVGTHLGPYPVRVYNESEQPSDIEPSGARVHTHGISIDIFSPGGKIVDHSVFYDEAAIRAQLELKATASRGRDTRSILRRVHDERAPKESPITVQVGLCRRRIAAARRSDCRGLMQTDGRRCRLMPAGSRDDADCHRSLHLTTLSTLPPSPPVAALPDGAQGARRNRDGGREDAPRHQHRAALLRA